MQPAFDHSTLDRLISLGRERGHLTTEDLRLSLPIDSMSAEEIAFVIVHLEEAGMPVEPEGGLLSSVFEPVQAPRSAVIIPFPGPRKTPKVRLPQPSQSPLPDPREPITQDTPVARWVVATAGALAFAVFSLIVFVTAG